MRITLLFMLLSIAFIQCTRNREMKAENVPVAKEKLMPTSLSSDARRLSLEGAYNTRDLGGIINKEGKRIKKGLLVRSDDFSTLSKKDLDYLSKYPVTTMIDFRSTAEAKNMANKFPSSVKNKVKLPITAGNIAEIEKAVKNNNSAQLYDKMYTAFVSDKNIQNQYKEFFKIIQNPQKLPAFYNCSTGKDRTGLATALVLYSLNVDPKVIMEDYLASNAYTPIKYKKEIEKSPQTKDMVNVKSNYLEMSIKQIEQKYGTVEKYLTDVLKVDLNKMRDLYLEK